MFKFDIVLYIASCWGFIIGIMIVVIILKLEFNLNFFKNINQYRINKYVKYLNRKYITFKKSYNLNNIKEFLLFNAFNEIFEIQIAYFKINHKKLKYPQIKYYYLNDKIIVTWNFNDKLLIKTYSIESDN